jgi:hypothetical protein
MPALVEGDPVEIRVAPRSVGSPLNPIGMQRIGRGATEEKLLAVALDP